MQVDDKTRVNARIAGAFKAASDATGTSFDYLASTAARESDQQPQLASTTSTAKGLFQFVDQTWLELVKKDGPSVGLERLADKITSDGKGGWTVADPKEKAKILALKTDPLVASVMAGKFTQANAKSLTETLGRAPSDGELYAAHVLGAGGAAKLVRMAATEPSTTAAIAFPKAAAANPALFYGKDGKPRTASELLGQLSSGGATTGATTASTNRIADAYSTLAAETKKLDPLALAAVIRAQAAAKVAGEPMGAGATSAATTARFTRVALAQTGMPGAASDVTPPTGARIDGWRARAPADAFSALMRSDAAVTDAAQPTTAEATDPTTAGSPIVTPNLAGNAALARATGAVGGAAGGIPYVDPTAPMRLVAEPKRGAGIGTTAQPIGQASGQPIGARQSRLMARAATGAPEMPLPMVTTTGTVARSASRGAPTAADLAASGDDTRPSGLVGAGATRVKTVSIAPAAPAGSAASNAPMPLLPPMPGDRAQPSAGAAAGAQPTRTPSRVGRPLDLLSLAAGRS